jgi:hypothetical protein
MAQIPVPGTKARWFLTIVIVGALVAFGLTRYNASKSEQTNLLASIAQSDKTIATLRSVDLTSLQGEVDELQRRVDNASAREDSLIRSYSDYRHSIEIQERLYAAATEAGVTITSMTCDGPSSEEFSGIKTEHYVVSVDATADVPPSLFNFLLKASTYFQSSTIYSVDVSVPRPPAEGTSTAKSNMSFVLEINYVPQETA